ncbi:MAG: hypothetical protein O3A06_09940, partial [Proteobacteria bacterium]|nr:hypothetical protein [Pseudomonadota bacterium]
MKAAAPAAALAPPTTSRMPWGAQQRLVDADATNEPSHAALQAANRPVDRRRAVEFPRRHQRVPLRVVLAPVQCHLSLAVRAQRAHQALRHDAVERGIQQVR